MNKSKSTTHRHKIDYVGVSEFPTLTIVHSPNISLSSVSLWFKAGARYAPPNQEGLPHLFEHLFISHNQKYKSKAKYSLAMEKKGLLRNAYTSHSLAEYHFQCLPNNEENALKELIESYRSFQIEKSDLIREVKIIANEELRSRNNPTSYIHRIVPKAIWPDTDMSYDIYGTSTSLRSISLADIYEFQKQYYSPDNMQVLIVSPVKINKGNIIKSIHNLGQEDSNQSHDIAQQSNNIEPINKRMHVSQDGKSINVCLVYRLGSLSRIETTTMLFISSILTGGWSSRLNYRLRLMEGLTYWVKSDFEDYLDRGCLKIYFSVDKNKMDRAVEIIKEELERLRTTVLSKTELKTAKILFQIEGSKNINNPNYLLQIYGYSLVKWGKNIAPYDQYIDDVVNLKAQKIVEVANKLLNHSQSSFITLGNL